MGNTGRPALHRFSTNQHARDGDFTNAIAPRTFRFDLLGTP
jgi:hypothetical protein